MLTFPASSESLTQGFGMVKQKGKQRELYDALHAITLLTNNDGMGDFGTSMRTPKQQKKLPSTSQKRCWGVSMNNVYVCNSWFGKNCSELSS